MRFSRTRSASTTSCGSVRNTSKPLASYVLRVRGKPASLRYELVNLRDGAKHVFRRAQSVAAFLQAHGIRLDDLPEPGDASTEGSERPSRRE